MTSGATPRLRTAPVLAILVCHDGEQWLGTALSALRRQRTRPRHVVAVDTGSVDRTAKILAQAAEGTDRVIDGIVTLGRGTGFAEAVHAAVEHAVARWGDPGSWLWLLHDDCAPEPDCLFSLVTAAEVSPSAAVLGPLSVDWVDPRRVVEAGVSTDASGHRQTGIGDAETVGGFEQSTEALAVSSAGSLVRRAVWDEVGGYDRRLPLLREDVDFGWRVNNAGHLVLCVPVARIRHACAVSRGARRLDAVAARPGPSLRGVDRAHGLRTFLVNCGTVSFVLGVPRVVALCLLRASGFLVGRRFADAHAEIGAARYLVGGRGGLLAARRARPRRGVVRGLFTSRITRLRNGVHGVVGYLVRRRVEADAVLGRLPEDGRGVWSLPSEEDGPRPVGPAALPAGVLTRRRPVRATGGLRRPSRVVRVEAVLPGTLRPSPRPRPSPVRRGAAVPGASGASAGAVFVEVDRARVLRSLVLGPPLVLVLGLAVFGILANSGRIGLGLSGGRLLPVGDLASTWGAYLSAWQPVAGGTTSPAPAALAVLGTLGVLVGGPQVVVALLLLCELPLAGLAAYLGSRSLPVRRPVRAVVAAAYALLPVASFSVGDGRLDVVVVHLLAPLVFAGVAAVLRGGAGPAWLPVASGTALAVAAVGAFSPLTHVLVVLGALVGFVVVPGRGGDGRRRGAGLFMVVLLPLALLLPWPAVVLQHPSVVLHGVGAAVASPAFGWGELVGLGPGWVGVLVVVFAAGAAVVRPSRGMLPGFVLVVVAGLAVIVLRTVPATPLTGGVAFTGFVGAPLVVAGWGLLWVVLVAWRREVGVPPVPWRRGVAVAGVVGVLGLAGYAFVGLKAGVVGVSGGRLPSTVAEEVARTGRGVLVVGAPTRQVGGRLPGFGDDDLVPTLTSNARLERWGRDLTSSSASAASGALASAAAAGVGFVVLPTREDGLRLRGLVGGLVGEAPSTSDGRPVLRVQLAGGNAVLLSPELARQARTGGEPPAVLGTPGIAPVEAGVGAVAVRVSEGPEGRLLVVGAEEEPGWEATVDGRAVAVVRAWGHLVGVALPVGASEVRVQPGGGVRELLLLVQAAAALFTGLTAVPTWRR
ncbi:glycosyltransferase family 2 protein [Actinosynnema sp. NPDC020468]|uniref:glycosyltransferase family 2 protein n=1 Tax=Actinosynnema sp. NPDC020468 TaxID=3154488 RepID=UPI0033F37931